MRQLSAEETQLLERRRRDFEGFLEERMPILADFAQAIGLDNPAMIVADPGSFLPGLDRFMRGQQVDMDDRVWIVTRLGYFVGEVLVQRLGGCWLLNEIPDSRFFGRYVVGQFFRAANPASMVDPFDVADQFVAEPAGRSLERIVDEVEAELGFASG